MPTLVLNGKRVFFNDGGVAWRPARPGVVLIHGAGMSQVVWQGQSRALAHHGFNIAAVDLPGHGGSEAVADLESAQAHAEWVASFIGALGMPNVHLAGHSSGAVIALTLAATQPQRVSSLALLGARLTMPVSPQLIADLKTHPERAVEFMAAFCNGLRGHLGGAPTPGTHLLGVSRALVSACDPAVTLRDYQMCNTWDGTSLAPRVTCPTLVLTGSMDRMTPLRFSEELARAIPGAQLERMDGLGHMLPTEAPRQIYRILLNFFNALPAAVA